MEERYASEHRRILQTGKKPVTSADIRRALVALGIKAGDRIMLHASVSAPGWTVGGAQTLLRAIMEIITPRGSLAMPSHSNDLSDPADWENPPVPESWVQPVRDDMPIFHPAWSSCARLGKAAELFRTLPGVYRSCHPHYSLSVWGADSENIAAEHQMDFPIGEGSPYHRMIQADWKILLYGVGYSNCTLLHHPEVNYFRGSEREMDFSVPLERRDGKTSWGSYRDINYDDSIFAQIGQGFEMQHPEEFSRTQLGLTEICLVNSRALCGFATAWYEEHAKV